MSDQIDPAFKAAYRETQGQPVDAVGRDTQVIAKPSIHLAKLMSFEKDGHQGIFDIIDGKFDYTGDLPVSDAARLLFETLADYMSEWWFERAATKTALAEKDARIAELEAQIAESDYGNLLLVITDIRMKSGLGAKPRLGDLADAIAAQLTASRAECEGLRAADDLYVVWSHEHSCWWRANSQGYARRVEDAGVYTRAEAISISHRGRDGWRPEEKPDELPIRVADLPDFARAALSQKETGRE